MWRKYFFKLFNVYGFKDVRHTEIHTQVSRPNAYEFKLAIQKLKSHKPPGIDQIPAELFKTGDTKFRPDICKLINSICNKEKLPDGWKQSITVHMYKKGGKTL